MHTFIFSLKVTSKNESHDLLRLFVGVFLKKGTMSGLIASSASANVWPRLTGLPSTGPVPFGGGGPTGLPTVTNPNLPSNTIARSGNLPPPVPQPPLTPFPSVRPPLGAANSLASNNYASTNFFPPTNPMAGNFVCIFQNKDN
jgi:hypothetical protein